ncbi:sigma-54-dependent Fis family transcriptional regulator [Brumimicrobium glaciale]|jgi:transcriptional regulator with PAS, ATPase and Fis domain|uniref:Sigma-54-dependent Fis family transcriptional regulator n=1 Tax=Brumimicrobium glaciale TaxID=200475 RepID=A0A4Q4KJQ5_9FLAO|nr:sigma-54 dependent transcriptional regulator [Brumimicrobium glaciale]RYM32927.1 sigma-54-dependent Fis family transcriptional regulator [Brumimicrobium glaciale]
MNIQQIKQRFGIIGNAPGLNRALEVAAQVAPTDISVLVTGQSGTGKEIIPQVIHHLSTRKHGSYIAVNCGAIPEGTIDSELFGHEKGAFTGASGSRKGYFEEADGGTIFLDEVAELPQQTQVRLLRVLETGEFIRVGSSKVIKTNVRVVAATNENMAEAIRKNKFREDLLYRLSTVPIKLPPLKERKEDIHLLFRKFAADFAEKYRMPTIKLVDDAVIALTNYPWPGNIRQLKNIVEQISVIENEREITLEKMKFYLPEDVVSGVPALVEGKSQENDSFSDRELIYKFLFDMKRDMNELKKLVIELLNGNKDVDLTGTQKDVLNRVYTDISNEDSKKLLEAGVRDEVREEREYASQEEVTIVDSDYQDHIEVEESLSLEEREMEFVKKALEKHHGKRKDAAKELGISERTLYRKIKEYNLK